MKTFTTAAVLATGIAAAYAHGHGHDHGHHAIHKANHGDKHYVPSYWNDPKAAAEGAESCGCYTYTTTWYGEATLVMDEPTSTASNTSSIAESTEPASTSTDTTTTYVTETPAYKAPPEMTFTTYDKSSETSKDSKPAPTSDKTDKPVYKEKAHKDEPSSSKAYEPSSSSHKKPASSKTSSSATPSSTSNSAKTSPNGDKWAFCYTPFAQNGDCKTASDVSSDVASIKSKGFTTLRLYSTDCSGTENVGAAALEHGMKLILGIYVDENGIGWHTDDQISAWTEWGNQGNNWESVEMVIAGNEAMFYGYTDAHGLADFVRDTRSKFRSAGFTGPVGTSEVAGTFKKFGDVLCPAVDYAGANIHPFFNDETTASEAGAFVARELREMSEACGGELEAYNLESGWPSLGIANGLAIPDFGQQRRAVESIMEEAGGRTAIFSYENDGWKNPGPWGVEQHWGCADLFE